MPTGQNRLAFHSKLPLVISIMLNYQSLNPSRVLIIKLCSPTTTTTTTTGNGIQQLDDGLLMEFTNQ